MPYTAPITDMRFAATKLPGFDEIARLPGGEELSDSLLAQILEEAASSPLAGLAP